MRCAWRSHARGGAGGGAIEPPLAQAFLCFEGPVSYFPHTCRGALFSFLAGFCVAPQAGNTPPSEMYFCWFPSRRRLPSPSPGNALFAFQVLGGGPAAGGLYKPAAPAPRQRFFRISPFSAAAEICTAATGGLATQLPRSSPALGHTTHRRPAACKSRPLVRRRRIFFANQDAQHTRNPLPFLAPDTPFSSALLQGPLVRPIEIQRPSACESRPPCAAGKIFVKRG